MEEKDLNIILKDFIATYMNPSYGGDFDLVKSKFPELDNQDPQVLKDYLATYLNPQYNGDIELVNSKFPELFQKKNLSGQGSQTGSEMSGTGSTLSQDSELFKNIKPISSSDQYMGIESSLEVKEDKIFKDAPGPSTFVKTEEEIQGGAIDNLFSAAKSSWKNVKGLSAGVVDEVVDMAKANVNAAGIPGLMAIEYSKVKSLGDKGKLEFQKKLNEYKEKQKKEAAEIEYDPNTLSGMIGSGAVYAAPSIVAIATAPFNPALAVGIGVSGTVAMTSTALVNGMDTYDDYKESKGLPSDPFARLGVGTAFMASEAAMEAIPLAKFLPKNIKTKILGRFLKDIPEEILEKKGKDLLEAFQKSSSSNKKLVQDLGKEVITGFGTEGLTEGATEFSNKMVEFIYQDAEDNKLDSEFFSEIGYAVLAGGVIGSGLGPLSYGSTNLSNKKRRERQKELVFAQNNKTGEVFEIASVNKDSGIVKVINKAGQSFDVDFNDINMAEAVKISNTEFSKFLKNSKESRSKSKDIKDVPDVGTEMMLNGSKVKVVSVNEDSSSVEIQDASGDVFEVPLSELSEFNDQYKEIVNLQFGEISYDFTKEKDGTLSFSEGDMNKDQAESTASMLNETYKGMDFSISEIPSTDPLVPSTYKINAKEKVSTDPSYKIDGATMDKPRFVEAINEATKEDSLNELETNDPEVQKLIDQKRSEITGIPITESVDAELNQEVEQLRAQEQAELAEALTDPEQYMVDGVIDGDKITDPAEKKIFDDIYKKYDERITPLLEASKATPETAKDSVKEYVEELNKTKSSDPETYWSVDEVSPESAAEGTIIKDEDGYGVVGKDGDIKGVFKRLESKARGVAQKILKKAIEAGGIKLDNFDTYLTGVYKKAGFRVVSRTKFNEEFAPDGWSKEKHGTPDVVAMVYDPDNKLNIEERLFDDPENGYDQMIEYRDSFVEQAKSLYPVAVKESTQTKASEVKKPEDTKKKTETDKKDAVIESIKKAGEVLKLAFPNVKMIVGTNVKDTRAKIEKELTPSIGAKAAKKVANSFDNANGQAVFSNGKPIAVIINQESAELSTAPHEVWHLILRDVFGKNPKKFEDFRNGVANSLINNGFENIAEFLDNFSSLYDGDITYEEYLAELGGQLVAQRVDPSKFSAKEKSFIQEFKELINKIARDVIGRDVFLKDATPENILEFMSNVSAVMAEGGDVRKAIGKSGEGSNKEGVDIVKQSTEAFSGKLTEMGISIGVTNPKTGKTKVTNFDVAKGLNEYYTKKYGTIPPGDFSQKAIDALADYASTEMLFAMAKFGDNSGKGWYTEDYSKALGILSSIDPDINKDPKIKAITTSIIAVASNSSGVYDNLTRVIYGISEYKKTGKIPLNVGTGKGQEAIATGIDRYNKVVEKLGNDPVRVEKFMSQIGKVSDLKKKLVKEFDMNSWAEAKKEFATDPDWNDSETLPMSVLIFGPKIGAFWSNLSGLDGTPTIDRWCIRTIYRYKGDMRAKIPSSVMKSFMLENGIKGASDSDAISLAKEHSKIFKRILTGKGEYSSLTKPEKNELLKPYRKGDQIWSKAQGVVNDISEGIDDSVDNKAKYGRDFRTFTKNVFEKARDIVFDQTGIKLSVSDVQAILWIYEKNLFGQLGVRQREDSTYSSAANSIVNKVKSGSLTVDMLKSGDLKALETDKISSDGPMGDTYTFEDKQFKNGLDSREKRSKESIEISKQEIISGDVEVTSQKELPSRVNQQINDIISEQRALEKKPAEISKEAIKYLKGTEAYAKLSDRIKKKVIDGVKRLSGMRVKVTVDEYASLKDQIKLEAKAAREVNFSNKSAIKQLSSAVKDMVSKGKISTFKASVIIRRIARTNFLDQSSVNSTISYIADVFDNANLAMKISRATSLIKAARKNAKSKLGQNIDLYTAVKSLLSVETSLIPTPMIDDYLSVLEILGERAKVLTIKDVGDTVSKINVILNSVKDKPPVTETQSKKETVEESVEASKSLMKDILSSPINTSKVSDVNDSAIARFLASITRKDLEGLLKTNSDGTINRSDLKTLAAVISNIEAGLVTNQAIVLAEKIDKNRRVAKLKNTVNSINTRRLTVGVSRAVGKIKGIITGKTGILEAIRATPLEFIDDVVGNYNDRTLRDAIFGKLASQKGKLDGRIADLLAKGEAAESLFNKGRTDNNAVRAKYKVMAYLIQKEHDSNPDNPGVAPAIDFINETIKAIRKNESSLSSYDAKILESIAKEFSKKDADGKVNLDSDKILFSLSKNDMKAMRLIEDINSSTANEALFTSGVVRGNRVNIISNYVHHAVTSSDASTQAQALVDKLLGVTPGGKVSTKAGTLNDRTPGAKPISFDPVYAAVKGAKDTLTDFYMTSEIRTVMSTMRDLKDFYSEQGSEQSNNIDIVNALYDALEESLKVTFQSHFHEDTSMESIVKKAQKLGYYTALASIPRAGAEFLSNVSYAVLSDPITTISATKFVGAAYSTDFLGFLTKIGSSETIRLASTEMLSGKYSEGSSLSGYLSGGRSKAGNKVLDYMSFISKYSLSGVQNISSAVSEVLISTPDKAISKPYYIAAFAKHFKNETGIDITPDDVKKMAEGTSDYLSPKFEKQLESARIKADREIVRLAASNNSFTTILKNAPRTSDSAMMSAYRSANSFMSRFYLTEYATVRSAVIALRKTGEISKAQAAGILAASVTRMSSYLILYSLLSSAFDSVISSMFDLPEEEEEEEGLMTKAKRSVTGQAVQMMTRRTLGNIGYIPVALAVENLNKEYGEDFGLRDGEYDPYKSSLVYAQVTEKDLQTKSPYEIAAKVSLGPYAPLASSVARFTVQTGRKMSQDSDKQILNAALESMDERAALEVSGNLGLLPFYKDIRRIMLSSMYASSNIEKNKSYIYSKDFIKTMESIDPEAAKEMKNKEKEMKAIFDEATEVQSSKKTKKDSELEIEEIIKKYYNK